MNLRFLLVLLLAIPATSATAGVNPLNGDFFITYRDIEQDSGGRNLNLDRTYNSRSLELGWFGFGWGSPFETHVVAMPDGSAAIQEHGGGQVVFFHGADKPDIQAGVARIVDAAIFHDKITPEAAEKLRQRLVGDENLRLTKTRQYEVAADLPVETVLSSTECVAAKLKRVAEGYTRLTCNGAVEDFDPQGRMVRRKEAGGYRVTIEYDGNRPNVIADSLGQSLTLKWKPSGLIAEATNGAIQVAYTHDDKNNLTVANTLGGNIYKYDYDGHHNLTRIGYIDNTSMSIAYVSDDGTVKSVTETTGEKIVYDYRFDPDDSAHYWTKITTISTDGEQRSREIEFQRGKTTTGAEITTRVTTSDGRSRVEKILDDKGRVVREANALGGFTEYAYDPTTDKLVWVASNDLRTKFLYDKKGNLVRAENSEGRVITLAYNDKQLIRRMADIDISADTKLELTFRYNAAGKPTRITAVGVGSINVAYDERGEISGVTSKQGIEMALRVNQAFQNLLNVVSVAGVKSPM